MPANRTWVSVPHSRALNQTAMFVQRAPAQAKLAPHVYLRAVRSALSMSQRTLARRAGVSQAHVLRVERGTDVRLSTLRRLFDAMFCDMLLVPLPRLRLGDAVAERRLLGRETGDLWDDEPGSFNRRARRRSRGARHVRTAAFRAGCS